MSRPVSSPSLSPVSSVKKQKKNENKIEENVKMSKVKSKSNLLDLLSKRKKDKSLKVNEENEEKEEEDKEEKASKKKKKKKEQKETEKKEEKSEKKASKKKKKEKEEKEEEEDDDIDEDEHDINRDFAKCKKKTSNKKKLSAAEQKHQNQLEEDYKKLSRREQIFLRPGRHIGSIKQQTEEQWVFDEDTQRLVLREITYVPGLYKLFDEIIVNAADNKQNDPKGMTMLKVDVDASSGLISVWNNGKGIPVEIHPKHGIYIPELLFAHKNTSTNYDDNKKRTTGGLHGEGAKLVNMFSSEFTIETFDERVGKRYTQTFTDNNSKKGRGEPEIKTVNTKNSYTKVSFIPDWKRFEVTEITADIFSLFKARVYEIAGSCRVLSSGVKPLRVYFNGKELAVKNFEQWVHLHFPIIKKENNNDEKEEKDEKQEEDEKEEKEEDQKEEKEEKKEENESKIKKSESKSKSDRKKPLDVYEQTGVRTVYEKINSRWEIVICATNRRNTFQQLSFVNAVRTRDGGPHVDLILNQLLPSMLKKVIKKYPSIQRGDIKNNIWIFVNSLIDNPEFEGQTKDKLLTKKEFFGGDKVELSEKLVKYILDETDILSNLERASDIRDIKVLKSTDGKKTKTRIGDIPKLEEANEAGGKNSQDCTLILTEGDSAKALAISGLAVVGRDYYGVFPLKGKFLNVRDKSNKVITANHEVTALKRILGLQTGKVYDSAKDLRYGHVMIMADQDHDGSHIKGLVINFFHRFWPELVKLPGFLLEFITPIIKVTKQKRKNVNNKNKKERAESKCFYTIPEFNNWKKVNDEGRGWTIKYYKGLGTSTSSDAKEYFSAIERHRLQFKYLNRKCDKSIELAFSNEKADQRKEWLGEHKEGTFLDQSKGFLTYNDFVNKELILFSIASNLRSIPSLVDGLKPVQRKILHRCFVRNQIKEVKVAQLAGSVSEFEAYHHGEASLQAAIVGMAQNFVGSNNINFLLPRGMFGTRLEGGKDDASARYIFTCLADITRKIFPAADDALLNYLQDDGQSIEPEWYVPIIPACLFSDASGIGTGYSTNIPNFNPREIVENLKKLMINKDDALLPMHPYYKNFTGKIYEKEHQKYQVSGIIKRLSSTCLLITELPIKTWTVPYKMYLELLVKAGDIEQFREHHTDTTVYFEISLTSEKMKIFESVGLYKKFKLLDSINTTNMVLFNHHGQLKKYEDARDIISEFFPIRLEFYHKRKEYQMNKLK